MLVGVPSTCLMVPVGEDDFQRLNCCKTNLGKCSVKFPANSLVLFITVGIFLHAKFCGVEFSRLGAISENL